VSASFRRLAERWPFEPGDGLLIVFASMLGLVWAFFAFTLAIDVVNPELAIGSVSDVVRIALLLPWFMFVFMSIAVTRIGYAPDSWGIVLLLAASGMLPGAIVGLLGVVCLHRG
jgi:ABC-type sugar transport system permease subunit